MVDKNGHLVSHIDVNMVLVDNDAPVSNQGYHTSNLPEKLALMTVHSAGQSSTDHLMIDL
jgi:hypothetical protein